MRLRRIAVPLVGGVLALGLGACGGGSSDGGGSGAAGTEASTEAESSTPATQEQKHEAPASQDGLTAPGTKLKFGQQANLAWVPPSEFDAKEAQGIRMKVSVDSIEEGSIDDFENVELEGEEKNSTPYYLNITIEAMEEVPASLEDEADLAITAIDDRGQEQGSVTFFGEFSRCNDEEMPKPMKPGDSFSSCMTYLIPGGGSIVEAQWNSGPVPGDGVSPYFEEPVVWGP